MVKVGKQSRRRLTTPSMADPVLMLSLVRPEEQSPLGYFVTGRQNVGVHHKRAVRPNPVHVGISAKRLLNPGP